jgi:hypothetical protein
LFPEILARLVDGSLTVTSVRLLARYLTADNQRELLTGASRRSKREVEELIARRFPKADTPSSVRKVPEQTPPPVAVAPEGSQVPRDASLASAEAAEPRPIVSTHRPVVKPLAADRYEIRFTASTETRDKLKVAQDLLRHAIPSGDVAAIFDRALSALIEAHSRRKMAVVRTPPRAFPITAGDGPVKGTRHVAAQVRRAVRGRDGGRCAFLATNGHRCSERAFLEYHHVVPYAAGGEATVANIQLRCRAHNGHEAAVFFGTDRSNRGVGGFAGRSEKSAVSWTFSPVPERPQMNEQQSRGRDVIAVEGEAGREPRQIGFVAGEHGDVRRAPAIGRVVAQRVNKLSGSRG